MTTQLRLPVALAFDPEPLVFIHVNRNSQGSALWSPARTMVASASNCNVDSVTVVGLQYSDGRRVLKADADMQPVAQLAVDNPCIVVQLPNQLEPPYVRELKNQVAALKEDVATLKVDGAGLNVVVGRLQRENAQYHKILIRILLDGFRNKYLGHELSNDDKLNWNQIVENMSDSDLRAMDIERKHVCLSMYGENTAQRIGGLAAHVADEVSVAYAVTAHKKKAGFLAIYRYVYGKDAYGVIEDAEEGQG